MQEIWRLDCSRRCCHWKVWFQNSKRKVAALRISPRQVNVHIQTIVLIQQFRKTVALLEVSKWGLNRDLSLNPYIPSYPHDL